MLQIKTYLMFENVVKYAIEGIKSFQHSLRYNLTEQNYNNLKKNIISIQNIDLRKITAVTNGYENKIKFTFPRDSDV
jgi:hypothetical protein